MRVIFAGWRDWDDPYMVDNVLKGLMARFGKFTVVHGAGRGADHMVNSLAKRYGLSIHQFPADWDQHGKKAGPLRNIEMVASGADLCVVFKLALNPINSGGTEHTVSLCCKAGIPVMSFPDAVTIVKDGSRYRLLPEESLLELRDGLRLPAAPAPTSTSLPDTLVDRLAASAHPSTRTTSHAPGFQISGDRPSMSSRSHRR